MATSTTQPRRGLLQVLNDAPGFAKISLQGPQGSGKSRTAVEIACHIHKLFKSKKPVAFFDTESGSDYLKELIEKLTGMPPLRIKTRAFSQLLEVVGECRRGASDILVVDSITHVWREIQASHMAQVNKNLRWEKTRMDIQDIMQIKKEWEPWPDEFLNSPLHVLVCGREGNEWGHEENEDTGKRDLVAVGKKMKVEGEFGYEASLMISMHAEQIEPVTLRRTEREAVEDEGDQQESGRRRKTKKKTVITKRPRTIINVATVLKDRFDEMNGVRIEMPSGKDFMPFLGKLNPPAHGAVDTSHYTADTLPEMDGSYMRVKTDREIAVEKVQAELLRAYPGQTAAEKKARNEAFQTFFFTRSWTEIEKRISLDALYEGLGKLREFVDGLEAAKLEVPLDPTVAWNTITTLSTELLNLGKSEDDLMELYKTAAGVAAVGEIQPESFGAVIEKLESELATLQKSASKRGGKKSGEDGNGHRASVVTLDSRRQPVAS